MLVAKARLKDHFIDGILMVNEDVPIGKEYFVDLGDKRMLHWINEDRGRLRDLECVPDVMDGGWLPLEVLEIVQ